MQNTCTNKPLIHRAYKLHILVTTNKPHTPTNRVNEEVGSVHTGEESISEHIGHLKLGCVHVGQLVYTHPYSHGYEHSKVTHYTANLCVCVCVGLYVCVCDSYKRGFDCILNCKHRCTTRTMYEQYTSIPVYTL